ncbi:MAG TPA: LON peptidase substrate-binding domain-containing protein, partial [Thermoleophilaceae bacterium]
MGETVERFPLFPLGIVLLPSEVVPLHIFEERYKLMIGECLETGGEFGIVWLSDEGLRDVGCTARVSQVLEELEDGRMNVLVAGGRPFRLLRRI